MCIRDRQRPGQALADHLQYRLTVEQRGAEVPVEHISQPAQIALHRRGAHAPVGFQLGHLFLAHGAQCYLAHIGLQRVQGGGRHQGKGQDTDPQQEQEHPEQRARGKPEAVFQTRSLLLQ